MQEIKQTLKIMQEEINIAQEISTNNLNAKRKGIYLLPNIFTTANLCAGFFAIIYSIQYNFLYASIAIFIAMVLDALDGRIARLTNTQSKFGAEYDSLCDMVAFGVSPAVLAFSYTLESLGNLGITITFIYTACAALRLARFNVQIGSVDKKWFIGLPSPAAAGVVAGTVWLFEDLQWQLNDFYITAFAMIVFFTGISMVLNIKYYSFKDIDFKNRSPFAFMLAMILIIALIIINPPRLLFLVFIVYACSGVAYFAYRNTKILLNNEQKT